MYKPSREEILAARDKTVPDVIAPDLKVLFCGINPGLYTAAVGHHFARPGNRFWPVLHQAGFTQRLLSPFEEEELLNFGFGITNLVNRATANAADLSSRELTEGAALLKEKLRAFNPCILAVLGIGAFRTAFLSPKAQPGPREEITPGTLAWVLPNPSGINAHYQMEDLVCMFEQLRLRVEKSC